MMHWENVRFVYLELQHAARGNDTFFNLPTCLHAMHLHCLVDFGRNALNPFFPSCRIVIPLLAEIPGFHQLCLREGIDPRGQIADSNSTIRLTNYMPRPPAPSDLVPLCCNDLAGIHNDNGPVRFLEMPQRTMTWSPNPLRTDPNHPSLITDWQSQFSCIRCSRETNIKDTIPPNDSPPLREYCNNLQIWAHDFACTQGHWVCNHRLCIVRNKLAENCNRIRDQILCSQHLDPRPQDITAQASAIDMRLTTSADRDSAPRIAPAHETPAQDTRLSTFLLPRYTSERTNSFLYVPLLLAGACLLHQDAIDPWTSHHISNQWRMEIVTRFRNLPVQPIEQLNADLQVFLFQLTHEHMQDAHSDAGAIQLRQYTGSFPS